MANLIEQMNILKGLRDEDLQGEMQAPSGSAPPFLVLSEINRRKDARQRYDAEVARQKPSTTVMEDLAGAPPAMPPMGAPDMGGGIAAAMPQQSFASGGIVDAGGYDDIEKRYNDRLTGLTGDKDRARALALLAASGAILGGGSSNTLKNIGGGISAFTGSYGDALKSVDSEETALLRGLTDINQLQQNFASSELDRGLRREELDISRERLTTDKIPADILKFEAFQKMSPEDKTEYLRLNPPYNPNAVTGGERLADDLDKIYQDAQKLFPIKEYDTAEEAAEKQRKAQAAAYQRIIASRGKLVADEWATNQGIAVGDLVVGGAPGAVLDEKDPLGLGL